MQLINTKQSYLKTGQVMGTLLRSAKSKFPLLVAVAGLVVTPTFLRADSDGNQSEHNTLVGTWLKANQPGVSTPLLETFASDGTLVTTRTIIVPTGPTSAELVSTGHGAWTRSGHRQFTATTVFLRSGISSGPSVEFTGFVKFIQTITLNEAGDQLTSSSTTYIYDADNNLLFTLGPVSTVMARVVAGQ
jgi:hypothetical protein